MNTSLTKIDLSSNEIGAEGAKAIGEGLRMNTSLTRLIYLVMKLVLKGERQSRGTSEYPVDLYLFTW